MAITSTEAVASNPVWRRGFVILGCCIALGMLSQFFRSSNGVIGPDLMADLGLTADQLGLLSGSFFIIFAMLQIPIGIVLDRFGARVALSAMLLLAIAGSVLFSLASAFPALVAARLLIGVGFAGIMVGSLLILSRWFEADRFTTAMSLLFGFSNAGNLLATLPLASAVEHWGWRGTFAGLAVLTAVLALMFYSVVRDAPAGHAYHARQPEPLLSVIKGLKEVLRTPGMFCILPLIAVGYASTIAILGLWGGPYLHDVFSLDAVTRGNVLLIMGGAMIAGTLAYGPLDRRFGTRKGVVLAGGGLTVLSLLALAAFPGVSVALTTVLLCAFAFSSSYSLVTMAHGVALFQDRTRGRGITTLNAALMGGAALLQTSAGELVAFSADTGDSARETYSMLFIFLALATAGALAIYMRVKDIPPKGTVPARQPSPAPAE
jgi:predicted MFS family arabinose efflux permease